MRSIVVLLFVCACAIGFLGPQKAQAHPEDVTILTFSLNDVRVQSSYGRALIAEFSNRLSALAEENRRIEMELEAEELALVERRAELGDEAFAPLAEAFDQKVRDIRAEQDAKLDALEALEDEAALLFRQRLFPVIAGIADERGADVVVDIQTVLFARRSVDITAEVIVVFDALFAEQNYQVLPSASGNTDEVEIAPSP